MHAELALIYSFEQLAQQPLSSYKIIQMFFHYKSFKLKKNPSQAQSWGHPIH